MNQKLTLSFIETNPFAITRWSWVSILLMTIGLYAVLHTGFSFLSQQRAIVHLNEKLDLISLSTEQKKVKNQTRVRSSQEVRLSAAQKKQIEETMSELTIAWNFLFQEIERTAVEDIALLEISPNSQKKQIVFKGEAKNLKAVFAYIKALDDTPIFSKVYLQSHSVDDTSISKPVRFTLSAEWLLNDEMNNQP